MKETTIVTAVAVKACPYNKSAEIFIDDSGNLFACDNQDCWWPAVRKNFTCPLGQTFKLAVVS
ncbi:MAG: hypothetical protein WCP18_04180 [bacterium]